MKSIHGKARYGSPIRIFSQSAKQFIKILYQKETKSDIKRQIGTIADKNGHCALSMYYLCIVNPEDNTITNF